VEEVQLDVGEMWGPILALSAVPASDLILESVLDRMLTIM
jgi:hypothetical protein